MTTKHYFKFLGHDRQPCHGGSGQWPLPGVWTDPIPNPEPCKRGYHLCRKRDLLEWCKAPTLWIVEADPIGILIEPDKVVVRSARLVRQVEEWNEKNQRLFAADCAENVLKNFESIYPNDPRPRQAIETARRFALGNATQAELNAAKSAAWSAAWSAARYASRSAARYASRSAAVSAAWSAARYASRSAAVSAAWSASESSAMSAAMSAESAAWSAAWSAARSAARSAAESAAESAAWSALSAAHSAAAGSSESAESERAWQINHLITNYLNLNPEDFA